MMVNELRRLEVIGMRKRKLDAEVILERVSDNPKESLLSPGEEL
jgi:hypothetical protein